jgi:hypothetical protein
MSHFTVPRNSFKAGWPEVQNTQRRRTHYFCVGAIDKDLSL